MKQERVNLETSKHKQNTSFLQALAYKEILVCIIRRHPASKILSQDQNVFVTSELGLTFFGLFGLIDSPPPCAKITPSVKTCMLAGIHIMMITGNNKLTEAIAV